MAAKTYGQAFMAPLIEAARQNIYSGSQIITERPLGKSTGSNDTMRIPTWNSNNNQLPDDLGRAANAEAKEIVSGSFKYVDVQAKNYSAKKTVDISQEYDQRVVDAGSTNEAERLYIQELLGQVNVKMEHYNAALLSTNTNYLAANRESISTSGDRWDSGGDPVEDTEIMLNTVEDSCGIRPNVIAYDYDVWREILKNALVVARIPDKTTKQVTFNWYKTLFPDVDQIIIRSGKYKTTASGTLTPFYSKKAGVYVVDSNERKQAFAGLFRDPTRDDKTRRMLTEEGYSYKFIHDRYRAISVIDNSCGGIIENCIS